MVQKDIVAGIERNCLGRSIGQAWFGQIYQEEDYEVVIGRSSDGKRICRCTDVTDAKDIVKAINYAVKQGIFK